MRNKEETKARILAAVGKLLAESGFQKIGINAIAREAGVDKVLIYRYFNGLPSLLRVFGREGDYWPSVETLVDHQASQETLADEMIWLLLKLLDELEKRPVTQEILRWELLENNDLTLELAKVREETALAVLDYLDKKYTFPADIDVSALSAIWVAGIMYLLLRKKVTKSFLGVNLQSPDWQQIKQAIAYMVERAIAQENEGHSH